jgi:hypothetical protein
MLSFLSFTCPFVSSLFLYIEVLNFSVRCSRIELWQPNQVFYDTFFLFRLQVTQLDVKNFFEEFCGEVSNCANPIILFHRFSISVLRAYYFCCCTCCLLKCIIFVGLSFETSRRQCTCYKDCFC